MEQNIFVVRMLKRYLKNLTEFYEKAVPVLGSINTYLSKKFITRSSISVLPERIRDLFKDEDLANLTARSSHLANINEKMEFLLLEEKTGFKSLRSPTLLRVLTHLRVILAKIDIIFRYFSSFQKKIAKLNNKNLKITERLEIISYLFTSDFHANTTESLGLVKAYLAFHKALKPLPVLIPMRYEEKAFLNKRQLSLILD